VDTMYVDSQTFKAKSGKVYTRHLLRSSYREGGKVKHETIANLSKCSSEEVEAIKLALRHKHNLEGLVLIEESVSMRQGLSMGAVWTCYDVARQLGLEAALGNSREGKLALWQVIARVVNQGSRLSAVRLAADHAACDILGLDGFDEDDLYANLDWLCERQSRIEDRLFWKLRPHRQPSLFLYDVTSSYLEGTRNELAAFGYNRDGKKGKRQIVIGLLCDESGRPLSIEVFPGNTQDPKTVASQIKKLRDRFGGGEVTLVGDRGMLKGTQVEDLLDHGFHYITAITKPQIEKLLKAGTLQMSLFDRELSEVIGDDGVRYVLRRNPVRAAETAAARSDKLNSLRVLVDDRNKYLAGHPRAKVEVARGKVNERTARLKLCGWVSTVAADRALDLVIDEESLAEESKLDGCYVIVTDLGPEQAGKEIIHARYKDLTLVEMAFRTQKTVHLEMRPVYVRRDSRTRGHALVVMLAYLIVQELALRWRRLDLTVAEGIEKLSSLCATDLLIDGKPRACQIPQPRASLRALLDTANVKLPHALPSRGINVSTRKKLPTRRKTS
jgi:DDE family transposase